MAPQQLADDMEGAMIALAKSEDMPDQAKVCIVSIMLIFSWMYDNESTAVARAVAAVAKDRGSDLM